MQRLLDRDLLTALFLFGVGTLFLSLSGHDLKDWVFPLLAIYLILGIAVVLLLRVLFMAIKSHLPDNVRMTPEDRVAAIDVIVFTTIVLVYLLLMFGLGFWLASLLMVTLTTVYLTLERSRHNMIVSLVVPFLFCVAAYFIFIHVFYVPFPKATWWPGIN